MDENLERQYVVSKLRADFPVLTDLWAERSAAFRALADGACDIAYAGDAREKLDIFHCGVPQAPLLIYLHGGYWQRGDKSVYSFIARHRYQWMGKSDTCRVPSQKERARFI